MGKRRDPPKEGHTMQRFDQVTFAATRTAEGFIRDTPIVGRTGILVYRNADGTERKEYRPPEEAFKADSLASLQGKPITIGHKAYVTAGNAAQVAPIGSVLSAGRQDGDTIRADIVIYNLDTSARELSCGYTLDLDETPGTTPEGEHYDAIQRNIVYNHLAVCSRGRAGVARLNMDGSQIIDEENLNKEETYNFIQRSFEQGRVETNGTEVSTILPPMSMFTPNNDRQEKKNKVIDKLLEFFDKFFSISNNKF